MAYKFDELLDVKLLNEMAEKLYNMAGIPVGIIDVEDVIQVKAGWQPICTNYHRIHPETLRKCHISDQFITEHLYEKDEVEYKCLNNMWDTAMPIYIEGSHLATLFVGQYFYDDEVIDEAFFEYQAELYGFDKTAYMKALREVPRFSRQKIKDILAYYKMYIQVMATSGHRQLEMKRTQEHLEMKVEERTAELTALNQELTAMNEELMNALERLKTTQIQLIESEKLASLGSLVAGMSHELSTPIGIVVTSTSFLQKELEDLKTKWQQEKMKRSDLQEFIYEAGELIQTASRNLERTDDLLRSFKQLSVDQVTEEKRAFTVKPYLEELMLSLGPLLKEHGHHVEIDCPDCLEVSNYPGALAQILTNLVTNSVKHGFTGDQSGHIRIQMCRECNQHHLIYKDDGVGMAPEVMAHMYEPFYTTKRGAEGGTGLGLHIVYNLVTQQMGGDIHCQSKPNQGVEFEITFE